MKGELLSIAVLMSCTMLGTFCETVPTNLEGGLKKSKFPDVAKRVPRLRTAVFSQIAATTAVTRPSARRLISRWRRSGGWSTRPCAVLLGEGGRRPTGRRGRAQHGGHLRELGVEHLGDPVELGGHRGGVRPGVDGAHRGGHHLALARLTFGRHVAHGVDAALFPGGADEHPWRSSFSARGGGRR